MSDQRHGRWEFDEDGNIRFVPNAGEPFHQESSSHTNQRDFTPHSTPNRNTKNSDSGWHWMLIVLGFVFAWPIGLVLLFLELSGKWPGSRQVERELKRTSNAMKQAAKEVKTQFENNQAANAQKAKTHQSANVKKPTDYVAHAEHNQKAKKDDRAAQQSKKAQRRQEILEAKRHGLGNVSLLRTLGAILSGFFGLVFVTELIAELQYVFSNTISLFSVVSETVPLLALCLSGIVLLGVAGSRSRKLKKFRKYLNIIGSRDVVPIQNFTSALGLSEKKVIDDLDEMLDRNYFDAGYVDMAHQRLVLREGTIPSAAPAPDPDAVPGTPEDSVSVSTLRHIREINNAIAHPEISRKIDRIEELTAKIFRLLEERPEKAGELRSFMNYYLPQTLKILENYAKLEAQGIEGDNILEAKEKIESMMDKLVDGYENQLDKLFAEDVLDISADLKVMEQMLEKDGLTLENELKF